MDSCISVFRCLPPLLATKTINDGKTLETTKPKYFYFSYHEIDTLEKLPTLCAGLLYGR